MKKFHMEFLSGPWNSILIFGILKQISLFYQNSANVIHKSRFTVDYSLLTIQKSQSPYDVIPKVKFTKYYYVAYHTD